MLEAASNQSSESHPDANPGKSYASMLDILKACAAAAALLLGGEANAEGGLLWFEGVRPTPQARALLQALSNAESFGLRSNDYALPAPHESVDRALRGAADAALRARIDASLTASASRFVAHLHRGRVSPKAAGFDLPVSSLDPDVVVQQLAGSPDVEAVIAAIEPRPPPYRLLRRALLRQRELAQRPELNRLPELPQRSVRAGEEYSGAPALRTLLAALGDLELASAERRVDALRIDDELAAAIERFQHRHGLDADGVLGPRTMAALRTPFAHRVRQIELTLERWRWTTGLERPDIVVNIPQFMLFALPPPSTPGAPMLEMSVIVGQSFSDMRTPVFAAAIERVVFQPYWDVPASIVRRELLPLIREDPGYLERNEMEIVRGPGDDAKQAAPTPEAIDALARGELRLRQRPGAKNALGPIKFVLPNPYSVFLHGTPAVELFGRSRRAFSHGCVRVSSPAKLAEYVLRNAPEDWTPAAIEAAMCGTETVNVKLTTPVRVLMFYGTAVAAESTGVMFFEDLYGHDEKLAQLLQKGLVTRQ